MSSNTYVIRRLVLVLAMICFTDVFIAQADTTETFCRYERDVANCSGFGNNLTYIPHIRHGTRELIFNNNYLPYVSNATFANVTEKNISFLRLSYDEIAHVASNAFDAFKRLETLSIDGIKVQARPLRILLGHLSRLSHLRILDLDSLSLESFPDYLFSDMKNNRLRVISLAKSNIKTLTKYVFAPLRYLEVLYLSRNRLTFFDLAPLKYLLTLMLNNNQLQYIPNFCAGNSSLQSVVPSLKNLHVAYTSIRQINSSILRCLPNLTFIDISRTHISILPNYMFLNVPNLQVFFMEYLRENDISVEPYAFKSTSLQSLSVRNAVTAKRMFESNETFQHSPNLRSLDCQSIEFVGWTDDQMTDMFSSLVKLEKLSFQKCKITITPINLFRNMLNLKVVNIAKNYIKELSPDTFIANKKIKSLILYENSFTHLNQSVLPVTLLNNLAELDLSHNPYACTCDLEWFIDWLEAANNRKHKVQLKYYPDKYICSSPSSLYGARLSDVSFTYRQCHPWGPGVWIGVIGGPLAVIILAISAIVYRNRWNIKHYIYLLRRRQQYNRLEGRNYQYDAFVAYNENDRQWIIHQLLPELENREGFRLCVHDRDFRPGMYINDNISERMDESRRIMLVLSDNFITSGWCRYEMKVAHARHIADDTDLIVVVLEKPKARNISKELKTLLDSTTYIEWTDDDVGKQLFWNKLKDAMKQ